MNILNEVTHFDQLAGACLAMNNLLLGVVVTVHAQGRDTFRKQLCEVKSSDLCLEGGCTHRQRAVACLVLAFF